MLRRRALILACVGSLTLVAAACEDDASSPDDASAAADDTAPGTSGANGTGEAADRAYAVGVRDVTLVDDTRPTDPNGDYPGAPDRTLPVRIWYPAQGDASGEPVDGAPAETADGPYPLVLFSHGFTATGPIYGGTTSAIAAAGYVVAAPTYPLSNGNAPGGPVIGDVQNQPADASFVIDEILADRELASVVDAERIGAAGHSLGAITTLGLGLASCCADERLDGAVAYSGLTILGPDSFSTDVPLLLVHGDQDPIVPYQGSVDTFAEADPPKYLVTLLGGDHGDGFIGGDGERARIVIDSTVDFLDAYLEDDASALSDLREDAEVPGVATLQEEA